MKPLNALIRKGFASAMKGLKSGATDTPKPAWERFLSSPGVIAIVTVLGTGVFGTIITGKIQEHNRRSEQAYLAYDKNLTLMLEVVKRAFEIPMRYSSASENLIVITDPLWRSKQDAQPSDPIEQAKAAVLKEFNDADAEWRKQSASIGYLLVWYLPEHKEVRQQWRDVEKTVGAYRDCALDVYKPEGVDKLPETRPCTEEMENIRNALDKVADSLAAAKRSLPK
jgi:hypothetical protein